MRRPIKKRPVVSPDVVHQSVDVERLINYIMLRGQKETARKIVYAAFEEIKNAKDGGEPLEIFNTAVRNGNMSRDSAIYLLVSSEEYTQEEASALISEPQPMPEPKPTAQWSKSILTEWLMNHSKID